MNVVNSMKEIFFRDISIEVKILSFNCYVGSVFLYNCETWILTKTFENTIHLFQRRLLRIVVLNLKQPNIITSDIVYAVTRQMPWSQVITRRELSWSGHLFHLSDDTPAKIAFQYSEANEKAKRQTANYMDLHDENETVRHGIGMGIVNRLAEDRLVWNNFIELVCPMGFLQAN